MGQWAYDSMEPCDTMIYMNPTREEIEEDSDHYAEDILNYLRCRLLKKEEEMSAIDRIITNYYLEKTV